MRITQPARAPYASAPVVLSKLLAREPVTIDGEAYNLDGLLASHHSAVVVSAAIWSTHDLAVSPTSITRWRKTR